VATKSILVITGPTASGKTEFAMNLAREDRQVEIVNADASLIYRGFDIGTAKPSKEIREEVPHHLIDILEPNERFSAADYSKLARNVIRRIFSQGKVPIVVGGTGFYIDALFEGIAPIDVLDKDAAPSKERYNRELKEFGFDEMHERLQEIDPILFAQIRRERNPIRLERAWTHYYATGEPLGEARKRVGEKFEYSPEYNVLELPRAELWQRIESRVDSMIADGWMDEAKTLMDQGISRDFPAMRAIGYREMFDVIEGNISIEKARELIIIRTRQYAKRQSTWMRKYISQINSNVGS
jgi:tRNA dimethylallyltransferase